MADEEFRIRPGRPRSTRAQSARPFIAQALAAAQKAGGHVSRNGRVRASNGSRFGRGRTATVQANRLLTRRTRIVVIKARVVRHHKRATPMSVHITYLRREGVTRDGEKAKLFGTEGEDLDPSAFSERCKDDRHHFRFIVSPEDASSMSNLRGFANELMAQVEKDLSTKLDWAGVDHWNTDNPHLHILVRGRLADGQDLVISRDYIKTGMRARAQDLLTLELGPRTDLELERHVQQQVQAEHFTQLDRQLHRDAQSTGVIDLAPTPKRQPDGYQLQKIGRLHKLETLGLARQLGPSQWILDENCETILRQLGERRDIIKRMHRALASGGIERGASSYVLAAEHLEAPIVGRMVERGLDNELKGTAYAVIDGVDGRTHHIKLPDLGAASDGTPGAIVELRRFDDARGQSRIALAVRSDLDIQTQVSASGATWLDRLALSNESSALSEGGFGAEIRDALTRRAEHLIEQGFAERRGPRIIFARNLLETLKHRELDTVGQRLSTETGLKFNRLSNGDYVSGTYRQRLALASGRFAMIENGLGFQLVRWTPSLDKQIGRQISGIARDNGGVTWDFARKRGISL